jgi:hypothetical protein
MRRLLCRAIYYGCPASGKRVSYPSNHKGNHKGLSLHGEIIYLKYYIMIKKSLTFASLSFNLID